MMLLAAATLVSSALLAPTGQECNYSWHGSAPFCTGQASDCTLSDSEFVRFDSSGDGHKCTTGDKVLCKRCAPSQDFLADWMGNLMPAIANMSLLDISLPGTHDSMSYDLSTRVSDNANDISAGLAWVLHEFGPIIGGVGVGSYIRDQAQTQGLSMKAQLEAGVRFVDFRITNSAAPNKPSTASKDWYSLHLVESNNKAIAYLQQAKDFLDAHPNEVLAIWISRHGEICQKGTDQFPDTTPAQRQAFFSQIKALFAPLLFDRASGSRVNETSLSEMVRRNQRVVLYVSDYAQFTANDTKAYDACANLDNDLRCGRLEDMAGAVAGWKQAFKDAPARRLSDKSQDRMHLVSLAGSPPDEQSKDAAVLQYDLGIDAKKTRENCASAFKIPNMTDWCPPSLLACEQLRAYYLQLAMETVFRTNSSSNSSSTASTASDAASTGASDAIGFPGAIYLDALDAGGRIRTGTTQLSQQIGNGNDTNTNTRSTDSSNSNRHRSSGDDDLGVRGYAYVDSLLLYNAQKACGAAPTPTCASLLRMLEQRRARYPLTLWDDPANGRLAKWLS